MEEQIQELIIYYIQAEKPKEPTSKITQLYVNTCKGGGVLRTALCEDGSVWEMKPSYESNWVCIAKATKSATTQKSKGAKLPPCLYNKYKSVT